MIDLKELLKAGVHFGHKCSRWSPNMRPYIWGSKNKVHLIDIAKTAFLLERTGKYLKELSENGKSFLWIGTKKSASETVKKTADSLKMPFVINRWIGGTLTNFEQVKKAITRLLHLRDVVKKPSSHYKKKELSMIQKEVGRLEKNIGGIVDLDYPPAAIIVIDAKKERSAVREAISASIPVIGLVDTNTDPTAINFVIPTNDDSPRSISFIVDYLSTCILEGRKLYDENKAKAAPAPKVEKKPIVKAPVAKVSAKYPEREAPAKPVNNKVVGQSAKAFTEPKQEAVKTEAKQVAPKATEPKKETVKAEAKKAAPKAAEPKQEAVKTETKKVVTKTAAKPAVKKDAKKK